MTSSVRFTVDSLLNLWKASPRKLEYRRDIIIDPLPGTRPSGTRRIIINRYNVTRAITPPFQTNWNPRRNIIYGRWPVDPGGSLSREPIASTCCPAYLHYQRLRLIIAYFRFKRSEPRLVGSSRKPLRDKLMQIRWANCRVTVPA